MFFLFGVGSLAWDVSEGLENVGDKLVEEIGEMPGKFSMFCFGNVFANPGRSYRAILNTWFGTESGNAHF